MPTSADRLKAGASPDAIQAAVSECISQLADEHPEWDNERRIAACHSMARRATGKSLAPKG